MHSLPLLPEQITWGLLQTAGRGRAWPPMHGASWQRQRGMLLTFKVVGVSETETPSACVAVFAGYAGGPSQDGTHTLQSKVLSVHHHHAYSHPLHHTGTVHHPQLQGPVQEEAVVLSREGEPVQSINEAAGLGRTLLPMGKQIGCCKASLPDWVAVTPVGACWISSATVPHLLPLQSRPSTWTACCAGQIVLGGPAQVTLTKASRGHVDDGRALQPEMCRGCF
jgi:hypothetical protein